MYETFEDRGMCVLAFLKPAAFFRGFFVAM